MAARWLLQLSFLSAYNEIQEGRRQAAELCFLPGGKNPQELISMLYYQETGGIAITNSREGRDTKYLVFPS